MSALEALLSPILGRVRELAEFAFPQRCPGCGDEAPAERVLCSGCEQRIPRLSFELCVRCLAAGREPVGCSRHVGYGAWAAWVYEERAAAVVHALKYQGRSTLAGALGEAIAAGLPPGLRPDLVVEVPLHPARRRERGYNQAAVLADAVARRVDSPRLEDALVRIRATREQARLGPRARRANLAGAFRVRDPKALAGRTLVIVDDVITTGCTLEACLEPLRAAGAHAIAAALAWAQ
jgi:ComF family protein